MLDNIIFKMKTPSVSIILPNYNHKPFLEQRLDSVFNQTFQDFEVILLDDASTDNSLNILDKYKEHPKVSHFIVNKRNSGGPFRQWKKGIELARGEYIWIAESDDYCKLDFLEKILKFNSSSKKNRDLIYCQSIDVDEFGNSIENRINYTSNFEPNIWKSDFSISGKKITENYLKVKNVIPNASAVVFKKSLLEENTFSDELLQMKMCGDWFFWIKLCVYSTNIGFIAEELNYFRTHRQVSRNHFSEEQKKKRLIEEAKIRRYLSHRFSISQDLEVKKLYLKWFSFFSKEEIFKKPFRAIIIPGYQRLFISAYINLKLNTIKNG
jgi:glycosyltransferase involved in cell wall biosynthesis